MEKIKTKKRYQYQSDVLLAPGPTMTPDWVWNAMRSSPIHHRTKAYRALAQELAERMRILFDAKESIVLFLSGAGTDMMERAVASITEAKTRISIINTGFFSDRWNTIAHRYSRHVSPCIAPWGQTYSLPDVKKNFSSHMPDLVLMQATETSTGVKNDPLPVSRALRAVSPHALFAVDAVLEAGVSPLNMDKNGIDIIFGASQKALMLPPGLGFIIFGKRALQKIKPSQTSFVFDVSDEILFAKNTSSRYTPPMSHMAGLRAVLRFIMEDMGEETWYRGHTQRAQREREFFASLGFGMFPHVASSGMSVLTMPERKGSVAFSDHMEETEHFVISPGLGKEADTVIRIAHFAGISERDWKRFHTITKKMF